MVNVMYFHSLLLAFAWGAAALPEYGSLAGLSNRDIEEASRTFKNMPNTLPVPTPITDTSRKLVADRKHPFKAPGPNDIRGPCPGLNTLANHGYLNRNGIVTPGEIIEAVQVGYNMGFDLASFLTFTAFIVDGNILTNLLSIGEKTSRTGPEIAPAVIGGLNAHTFFEGDASSTRGDAFFGDNFSFNETLFQQIITTSNEFSTTSKLTLSAMKEIRWNRLQDSIARNPTFDLTTPRHLTVYAETVFPFAFFANGTSATDITEIEVDLKDMRTFFQGHQFPKNFHRREGAFGLQLLGAGIELIRAAHPILPGGNADKKTNNFVVDTEDPGTPCFLYNKHLATIQRLYPNPQGKLIKNLKQNLVFFYDTIIVLDPECAQLFPYGQ